MPNPMANNSLDDALTGVTTYRTYNYRFLISTLYLVVAVINSVMWVCVSPIQTDLMKIYNLDLFTVNFGASLIYLVIYIPMSFVGNYIIDEKGLKVAIMIGAALTIIGLWVRTLCKDSFYFICLGQALGAIGAPCILNTPQKISASWYGPSGRALSTTLLSLGAPIGVGAGFFMSGFFVNKYDTIDQGLNQVFDLMWFTATRGTILLLPALFLMKEKPPTPPSAGAAKEKYSYKESLNQLSKNQNFLIFLGGVAFFWGTYSSLATIMNPLISPMGYESIVSGYYGGLVLVTGMTGSIIWGIYVGISKKYKRSLLTLASLSTSVLVVLLFVGPKGDAVLTGVWISLYGFFTTPMLPIIFELCCEITFPVAEANAGGLTYMMTQLMGIVGTLIANIFLGEKTVEGSLSAFKLLIGMQSIGLIAMAFTKEDLRRTNYEQGGDDAAAKLSLQRLNDAEASENYNN